MKEKKEKKPAWKGGFFRKVLLVTTLAMVINALLTVGVFTFTSRNMFANMKAGEMRPRAKAISGWTTLLQQGDISRREYERLVVNDGTMWDAMVHIFDAEGNIIAVTTGEQSEKLQPILQDYIGQVTGKQPLVLNLMEKIGIVVGVPVYGLDGSITGAVFLTKPLQEFNTALHGLNTALIIGVLLGLLVMVLPIYFISRNITRPLSQMTSAAHAMANGDFSVQAEVDRRDELGQLGQSLNDLSAALSKTIGDLMLERNRLKNVLDGLSEGVMAISPEGFVTHCNPAAIRLLGGTEDTPLETLPLFPTLLQTAGALKTAEQKQRQQVGEAELLLTFSQFQDQQGSPAGVLVMIQDVTEAVRLEQTRREYVANVSHELRTPIASIRSLADALNDGMVKSEADQRRYYGYIVRESMRMTRLINDLLELSRLQSGGVALTRRAVDISITLKDLAERFSMIASDSGLGFELKLPDAPCLAYTNEDRAEQVIFILLDNAVKYAAEDGRICLSIEEGQGEYIVSIRNTGHIDPKDLPYLFDRFYKADKAHTGGGTGLGLAIAKEVMVLMEERIWAQNDGEDVVFSLTLKQA